MLISGVRSQESGYLMGVVTEREHAKDFLGVSNG